MDLISTLFFIVQGFRKNLLFPVLHEGASPRRCGRQRQG